MHQGLGIPPNGIPFKDNDWFFINNTAANLGLSAAQVQALTPFVFGQTSLTQRFGGQVVPDMRGASNYNQPNETFKFQYSNNLNATTFVTTKFYRVDNTALFDFPTTGNGFYGSDFVAMQGGQRTGFAIDGTKQLGSKNLIGFGGKYDFLRPVYSQPSASTSIWANAAAFFPGTQGYNVADFLPNNASCPLGPNACGYLLGQLPGQTPGTPFRGYSLGNAFSTATGANTGAPLPAALQLPYSDESTNTLRQDFALYIKDTYSPTDRLKIDIGLRMDGVNWKMPTCDIFQCAPTSQTGTVANAGLSLRLRRTRARRACFNRVSPRRSRRRTTTRSASATGVPCSSRRSRRTTHRVHARRTRVQHSVPRRRYRH